MNTENLNYPNDPGWLGQFWHPEDVVADTRLSKDKKRALLAAWASDERSVLGDPTLRQLPNGAVVGLAFILDALRALDASEHKGARPTTSRYPDHRHDRILTKWRRRSAWHWKRDDDDDDPPPAPASIAARPVPAWLLMQGLDLETNMARYTAVFADTLRADNRLCLAGMLGAERNALPEDVRSEVVKYGEMNERWLAQALSRQGSAKPEKVGRRARQSMRPCKARSSSPTPAATSQPMKRSSQPIGRAASFREATRKYLNF